MSSSICHHFTQNAWKKDLCSNCFKSKDEHKQAAAAAAAAAMKYAALKTSSNSNTAQFTTTLQTGTKMESQSTNQQKTDYPNKNKKPAKSIIKKLQGAAAKASSSNSSSASSHKHSKPLRVCFPKQLSEVIGYGGEWSDNDSDDEDDFDFVNIGNERDDLAATSTDDEETIEIKRITRANTDFNMNNGNLLGNAEENIKKSFAALKLGAPQVDKEGKKQTLKINVVPFGAGSSVVDIVSTKKPATTISSSITSTASNVKAKFESKTKESIAAQPSQPQLLTAVKVSKQSTATTNPTSSTTVTKSTPILIASRSTSSSTTTTATTILCSSSANASSSSIASSNDGKNSPPIERAMEKSLLDEISETLEKQNKQKQNESQTAAPESRPTTSSTTVSSTSTSSSSTTSNNKIKFEISSLSDTLENKTFLELKKPIARNAPITKDHAKPKVNVFHKYSDTDSNCSDSENGVSAYYDVVETNTEISYENLPDGKYNNVSLNSNQQSKATSEEQKSVYSSSQYITDMLLSSKTRAASYNLHEGNFMTSKITSDGLIVTKCSSDDALDSTGSSFDGSSDEETSYNMIRSESDSGIGISIGSNEYKNVNVIKQRIEKKLSASTNNSDYEDIQIGDQAPALPSKGTRPQAVVKEKAKFSLEKSRELHGEPDGSADPDGNAEAQQQSNAQLPSLPKSPPPTKTIDARPSFLHGLQKQQQPPMLLKKPDLPAKPLVSPVAHGSPLKTFINKRQVTTTSSSATNDQQQQVIQQLQSVMTKHQQQGNTESQQHDSQADSSSRDEAKLKKGKAPNPPPESPKPSTNGGGSAPPTPERDYSMSLEFEAATAKRIEQTTAEADESKNDASETKLDETNANKSTTTTSTASSHYTRNSILNNAQQKQHQSESLATGGGSLSKASSPVIREKDKRERATINPKFRSLNTFVMQRTQAVKNMQLQNAGSTYNLKQSLTPEPTPRNHKNLSLSQECLADTAAASSNTKSSHKSITASIPNLMLATTQEPSKKPSSVSSSFFSATFSPTVHSSSSITLAQPQQKQKAKFSIKKFLRMGTHSTSSSKSSDNLNKKDSIYSEICTGDDGSVIGKPRLVIIHPIDINPTAVEVVKDITKTNDAVSAQTVAVNVANKPPAPPQRLSDAQRNAGGNGSNEANKPARPPPPKSAELRRKQQKLSTLDMAEAAAGATNSAKSTTSSCGSLKCKSDNVYANLGEIRSSIAPRKPERTASMREREAQLELARKRHGRNENADTASICSSNGVSNEQQEQAITKTTMQLNSNNNTLEKHTVDGKPPSVGGGSRTSTFEKIKKNDPKIMLSNKLELFEQRDAASDTQQLNADGSLSGSRPSSLKDSVRKINCTIDSYLKDKREFENMYEMVKSPASPPPPPARSSVSEYNLKSSAIAGGVGKNEGGSGAVASSAAAAQRRRNQLFSDTASLASYTRSEYGPTTQNRGYGFHNSLANIPRIISASYCGSEVGEFDIYAPYSYYGSETGGDVANDINDSVWGMPSTTKNRLKATNRLRMRKGRSVVHKNIEDNYTAVVVANHEALAQVLDQLQQTPIIPPALRPLANAINLRFEDFNIIDGAQAFVVGKKAFHAAVWTSAPVTLALSADCNQLAGVGGELNQLSGGVSGVLNPITEFCDLVPSYHLPLMPSTEVQMLQATISVLPRLQLDTLQTIGAILKGKSQVLDKSNFNFRGSIPNLSGGIKELGGSALRNVVSVQNLSTLNEESSLDLKQQQQQQGNDGTANAANMPAFDDVMTREVAFIMLQLVNGMKHLQVKAIEEMPLSLSNVVLSKDMDNKDAQARLCVLQGNNNDEDEPMGTLCKCAHIALTEMLPTTKITPIVGNILQQERAESLSKVKSVLEFVLWGPSDVTLTGSVKERELALQRWLDLERATVLHGLVRTRVELTVYDECHLMFLVRSTAKIMNDAAKIVCSYQQPQQSADGGKTQSGSLKEE